MGLLRSRTNIICLRGMATAQKFHWLYRRYLELKPTFMVHRWAPHDPTCRRPFSCSAILVRHKGSCNVEVFEIFLDVATAELRRTERSTYVCLLCWLIVCHLIISTMGKGRMQYHRQSNRLDYPKSKKKRKYAGQFAQGVTDFHILLNVYCSQVISGVVEDNASTQAGTKRGYGVLLAEKCRTQPCFIGCHPHVLVHSMVAEHQLNISELYVDRNELELSKQARHLFVEVVLHQIASRLQLYKSQATTKGRRRSSAWPILPGK